jgi:hypothetical protein
MEFFIGVFAGAVVVYFWPDVMAMFKKGVANVSAEKSTTETPPVQKGTSDTTGKE